jgi:hypothetical protein
MAMPPGVFVIVSESGGGDDGEETTLQGAGGQEAVPQAWP